MSVDLLVDSTFVLAEGPRWDAAGGRLLWVDIERGELHAWDGATHDCTQLGTRVGAVAPTEDGDVLLALQDRLALLDGGTLVPFPWPAEVRANDGNCDPEGRFWIGSMPLDEHSPVAELYRFDGVSLVPQLDGLTISNGMGWQGPRMYFIDTPTGRIDVFDYDGEIANRRTFARVDRGHPDGMCLDDEGFVWVACHGGGCVQRFAPDGSLDRVLELPDESPTCPCFFGGALVVTSRSRIWITDVGVGGPPAQPFRSVAPSEAEPTSSR
ncbi:MAG: SMP-30/gluconolactonase/LRE family protein [Actinomycetota bacterium]